MVYLPPPQLETPGTRGYEQAYNEIVATHRSAAYSSASSLIILVAPDVDALCAARILEDLLRQDDIMHRIIPVSGMSELERVRDELVLNLELRTLVLLNMGAILDLPSLEWFGAGPDAFSESLRVHIIDANRPQNLSSLFGPDERIVVWDDGGAEGMNNLRKAWEALAYAPESDGEDESDDDDGLDDDEEDEDEELEQDEDEGEDGQGSSPSRKRRRSSPSGRRSRKRKRDGDGNEEGRVPRLSRADREDYAVLVGKHYSAGTYYGQSASSTLYILATVLARTDNNLLWLAILGVTYQYATSKISRTEYEKWFAIYDAEVKRLNKEPIPAGGGVHNPDDHSIRTTEELRFAMWRHWNLYDAMTHSGYVASKLGIWRDRGRKRLQGLLAKMGFSIIQAQQPYPHMELSLKKDLPAKLDSITPEYGMVDLTYASFMRCCGYRASPLSAADSVEAVQALLHVGGGVKLEIEIEGARNGGEWFGGGRVWKAARWRDGDVADKRKAQQEDNEQEQEEKEDKGVAWWFRNFWHAYDALNDVSLIREALQLSMALHRAIIRQGSSIIEKQDIRTMRGHRVVVIAQGPDLEVFTHPGALGRLALWLVDTMRERLPAPKANLNGKRRKNLPLVLACLNERAETYIVVGVNAALEMGDVRKNEFGLAFLDAKERCNARTRHSSFDTNVLEIRQEDLNRFLQTLVELGPR